MIVFTKISGLLRRIQQLLIFLSGFLDKNIKKILFSNVDFYDSLAEDVRDKHKYTTYDLISNVVHDGKPQTQANKGDIAVDIGRYRVQLVHEVNNSLKFISVFGFFVYFNCGFPLRINIKFFFMGNFEMFPLF